MNPAREDALRLKRASMRQNRFVQRWLEGVAWIPNSAPDYYPTSRSIAQGRAIVSCFRHVLPSSFTCGVQGAGEQYAVCQRHLVIW